MNIARFPLVVFLILYAFSGPMWCQIVAAGATVAAIALDVVMDVVMDWFDS